MTIHFSLKHLLWSVIVVMGAVTLAKAQVKKDIAGPPKEEDFYQLQTVPVPEDIFLEVGGMALLPNDKLAVCTRRGEVWIISNPYMKNGRPPQYRLFAQGLHEPLGLAFHKGDLYVAQRPQITRLRDKNNDGVADEYKNIYTFAITGNYHEYAYGPVFDNEDNMFVTLNLGWFRDVFKGGAMESRAPWRGWMLKVSTDGQMTPFAAGFRSPAALTVDKDGNVFFAENQGEWVGSGHITEVKKGDFLGQPSSLAWADLPGSPVKLKAEDIPDSGKPEFEVAKQITSLKTPSVWVPHAILGVSTSGLLIDYNGQMGPFEGQFFVGDQGQSMINRVALEKVKGVYQGAVFPFRKGFSSGVLRLCWGADGSMFVGMTSRGWGSGGGEPFGLQRLVWNGNVPFEIKRVHARPDGFELEFTLPVDKRTARAAASCHVRSFTYKYHRQYGSPIINSRDRPLKAVTVSPDGLKVRLVLDSLKEGYIHEINAAGIRSAANQSLLHNTGYYTLNRIPDGPKMTVTAENRVKVVKKSTVQHTQAKRPSPKGPAAPSAKNRIPDYAEVKPLLTQYTCLSCHDPVKRLVGPPYAEVAKRGYSIDKMIRLIHNPEPRNWPDYATPMPPMPDIPAPDMKKIATWINSLAK
ncbi:DUF7133 domain-containing protein [Chitinophaga alhagiae]|uniref:DUF7133 domain-containing protein n=1 Tax=Chitinophaga alhagiae TaxID=2203219 RepID=UPI0018E50087|nr:hypothetical protein [Chitinophaga alhagiae]